MTSKLNFEFIHFPFLCLIKSSDTSELHTVTGGLAPSHLTYHEVKPADVFWTSVPVFNAAVAMKIPLKYFSTAGIVKQNLLVDCA